MQKTTALIRRRPVTCVYQDLGISQTVLTGLEFFLIQRNQSLLCRSTSTIHFTLPYIFNRNTYNCQSQVARDRRRRSELAKSIRRRSTDQYHSHPKRIFVRTMCFGKAKRTQTKAFSVQWRKVSPLFDGAVVRALRTEHCFVTCDAVLIFFAVPKTTFKFQILFSFSSDKDRRKSKLHTQFPLWLRSSVVRACD